MSTIHLSAPPGFVTTKAGLPAMTLMGEDQEDPWLAKLTIGEEVHLLEIAWWPKQSVYMCRYVVDLNWEEPREVMHLNYPHEIVTWVGQWFQRLHRRVQHLQDSEDE